MRHLRKEYRGYIKDDETSVEPVAYKERKIPVWVCWWQGEKMMPLVPKVCIKNLRRNMLDEYELIVISEENYNEYIHIPDYIIKKVNEGRISITNFSDIIRFGLLSKYGGLWIDATCYTVETLSDITSIEFYSSKQNKGNDNKYVSRYRWASYLIGGTQRLIFSNMYTLFLEYCRKEPVFVHYLLLDYFLCLIYEESLTCRQAMDKLEVTEPDILVLQEELNDKYSEDRFPQGIFHKLSWKLKFNPYMEDNKTKTFWGEIIDSI